MPRSSPATSSVLHDGQCVGGTYGFGGASVALVGHGPDDLRNDVAGALHLDDVALAQILARDEIEVVQRRQLHRGPADFDGFSNT